jgi:hypothetical protein
MRNQIKDFAETILHSLSRACSLAANVAVPLSPTRYPGDFLTSLGYNFSLTVGLTNSTTCGTQYANVASHMDSSNLHLLSLTTTHAL